MRRIHVVAACGLALGAFSCGGPKKAGDSCTSADPLACESAQNVLACVSGKLVSVPCPGVKGCTDSATSTSCDLSVATADQACPPWAQGNQVCQFSPSALLQCDQGKWVLKQTCLTCSTSTGAAMCLGTTTTDGGSGSDGGTTGSCSPANCTGCCSATGVCIAQRSAEQCGTGGNACVTCGSGKTCDGTFQCVTLTGCNSSTCADGCCANGQCVRPPQSPTNTACGPLGGTCTDCTAFGLVCNPTNRSCQTTSSGGSDAGDACHGVPVGGSCLNATTVQFCSVPTGQGSPEVKTYACTGSSTCKPNGSGASCVAASDSCTPSDTRCTGGQLETCDSTGAWGAGESCGTGSCVTGPVGGYCAASVSTVSLTATLKYQVRTPVVDSSGFFDSDWSTGTSSEVARNVVVRSVTGTGTSAQVIDTTTTNASGQYTIKVPAAPTANDRVIFSAMGGDYLGIRYAVVDPGVGTGEYQPGQDFSSPRLWSWSTAVSTLANGGTTTITTAQGSGALNVYDELQTVYVFDAKLHRGNGGKDVVVWFALGTTWSCGACFLDYPGAGFASQVFMGGDTSDQPYWGDAVMAHEVGHWAMASYGTSPAEGGTHIVSIKTFPGQAWSEGWATFHSSAVRNDPVYFDRQGGGMFWFSLGSRLYYPASTIEELIVRTKPDGGMLQQIDENDVAAMLWSISQTAPSGLGQLHNALESPHLNTSPWPSGYTRHEWSTDSNGNKTNVVDTREPSLHLGDMLDALRCSGMAASFIDTATSPTTAYPYKSASPSCRPGYCYGCLSNGTCQSGNTSAACGSGGVPCAVCTGACSNGVCQ